MGVKQEEFIQEFCDLWGDGTAESRPEIDKIIAMMSEDAEWQLWVPGGPVIKGREDLRTEILRQMSYVTENKCNIVEMVSSDRVVMTERADYAVVNGRPQPHSMVAVYELDEQGLICSWREYLDTADLARKSGRKELGGEGS
ncbi:nuclear transport factor 2 family protein [Zhongshania guokunii]|uniref:Nuclear transport factor 2 family protein n=1 Tax=Zhongshania guokunii TaxID=641783 RepID=A0ABV3U6W7_9GAMM